MIKIPFIVDPAGENAKSYKALAKFKANGLVVVDAAQSESDPNQLLISLAPPPTTAAPAVTTSAATTGKK